MTADDVNLTEDELKILKMVVAGLTVERIAVKLGLSRWTIDTRLSKAKGKLGTTSTVRAACRATVLGIVTREELGL